MQKKRNYMEFQNQFHPIVLSPSSIKSSNEKGFSGDSSLWFSESQFYSNLQGNSDLYHEKDYYFNSYSTFYIHEEMLKDKIRTGSYEKAIMNNKEIFKDKIVLDIGSGTGILAIFACFAGAKHVYAIEFADIADYAKEIIKINNLQNQITIFKKKVEEVELPCDKVDIIISEWMGYFLLYESMLDTVLYARNKWLKENGILMPDRAKLYLCGLEDQNYKYTKINSWENVFDFDFSFLKGAAISEPLIDVCNKNNIISTVKKFFDIDLYTVKKEDLDFSSGYEIEFIRDDTFNCLVCWFDVVFSKVPNKVTLKTGPFDNPTHWKQTIFYIEDDIKVKKGEKLKGCIAAVKDNHNFRFIDIKISFHFTKKKKDYIYYYKIA